MARTPERTAWTVLFTALFACLALAIGIPTAVLAYINNATNSAYLYVRLQAGRMVTLSPVDRLSAAPVVGLAGRTLGEGHAVIASDRTVGLVTFAPSESDAAYIKTQLYANARIKALRARSPRFETQNARDEFVLELQEGRIDILVLPEPSRAFQIRIQSEFGSALLETPGAYTLDLQPGQRLRVVSRDGDLVLNTRANSEVMLKANQAAELLPDGSVRDDLPLPGNIVRNGYFQGELLRDWTPSIEIASGESVAGQITRSTGELSISRAGANLGWGRTGVTQKLDQQIAGRKALRLRLVFRIQEQGLQVCGSAGTECPLMVRIAFKTADGADRFWQQGFYAAGNPEALRLPTFVVNNNTGDHVYKSLGQVEVFESENLLAQLGDVQSVTGITLYGEGHALRTHVNAVELLVED